MKVNCMQMHYSARARSLHSCVCTSKRACIRTRSNATLSEKVGDIVKRENLNEVDVERVSEQGAPSTWLSMAACMYVKRSRRASKRRCAGRE
jgi:hypothetical protein